MNVAIGELNLATPTAKPLAPPVVPNSICFTMDKNRTWAQDLGLPPLEGHSQGKEVAENIATACFDAGVCDVIMWAMSQSNAFSRSIAEKEHLKKLLKAAIRSREERNDDANFHLCGDWARFRDTELDDLVARASERNKPEYRKRLTVLFWYRGITDFKQGAAKVCEEMGPEAVKNEDMIRRFMWIKHLPQHVDMMVRTGVNPRNKHNSDSLLPLHGEQAFIWDVPQYWPEFSVADLYESFRVFGECKRAKGA